MRAAARLAAPAGLACGVALGALVLISPGCSAPPPDGAADDGSERGTLAVYIADDDQGRSETRYALRDVLGNERPLLFDAPPAELEPDADVKIWGVPGRSGLRVTSYARIPKPDGPITSALIGATPFPERSFAFVLVDIGSGVNTTEEAVTGIMETNDDSIKNYYLGDSYQMQSITTSVFGPFTYSMTACATTDTTALANALRPMVTSAAGGATFQHYLWYLGSKNSACSWSGLASVGTAQSPSRDTWYNASTNCVVLVQEPGHNFGMQHSSSLACPGAAFADDPNTCTGSEYGDRFDPMGGSGGSCRHMNAWQKAYQGWFGGCNGVRVTSSGTFNLVPYELACTGTQFLQIKAPKARSFDRSAAGGGGATVENLAYYYVELRTANDFDGTLGNRSALAPTVLVHVADDLHTRTQRGVHTFLLDMTPSTAGTNGFSDAGLSVGQTFTDPAGGLSITTQSAGPTGATIVVTYDQGGSGDPQCLDGTTFAPPGPGLESCEGQPASTGGTGGATGAAGAGGTSPVGTGGSAGAQAGSTGIDKPATGGCACQAAGGGPVSSLGFLMALALAATGARPVRGVRRCRRSSTPESARGRAPRPGR